jgi:hypothetical protein
MQVIRKEILVTNQSEVVITKPTYSEINRGQKIGRSRAFLALLVTLSILLGFATSNVINGRVISQQDYQLKTSGIVNLNENELLAITQQHDLLIYWSGPIKGYSYSLILDSAGSSILKYIPESGTASNLNGSQREIATYQAEGAWDKSLVAAGKIGISSFRNVDGSLVFYNPTSASDIFMAFKGRDVQVEVFDSRAGQALSLAMLAGQIRPVVDHEEN